MVYLLPLDIMQPESCLLRLRKSSGNVNTRSTTAGSVDLPSWLPRKRHSCNPAARIGAARLQSLDKRHRIFSWLLCCVK